MSKGEALFEENSTSEIPVMSEDAGELMLEVPVTTTSIPLVLSQEIVVGPQEVAEQSMLAAPVVHDMSPWDINVPLRHAPIVLELAQVVDGDTPVSVGHHVANHVDWLHAKDLSARWSGLPRVNREIGRFIILGAAGLGAVLGAASALLLLITWIGAA